MLIRFPEFKTTLIYDTSRLDGDSDRVVYDLLLETVCRLPISNISNSDLNRLKIIIQNNYLEYKQFNENIHHF